MMKRLALVADTHADASNRFDEHNRIMSWIAVDVAARGVDLVVHAGDAWERKSTSAERAAVGEFAVTVAERAPIVFVAGNHDDPLDIVWLSKLRSRHAIHAFDRPAVVEVGGFALAALPWPRKANLLAVLGAVAPDDAGNVAQEALRDILRGLGRDLDGLRGPRVLGCHVMIDGARTDHNQPVVGADMACSVADLGLARADFTACGHIHAANEWEWNGAPVVYPGAPRHTNFGEFAEGKGYVVADFEEDGAGWRCSAWERIAAPCTPMLLVAGRWTGTDLDVDLYPADPTLRGADVRMRYAVPSDARDAARARASAWETSARANGGAVNVKLEEQVEATARARAPEVATAATLADKLRALWASRNEDLGARAERLVDKATDLERRAAA